MSSPIPPEFPGWRAIEDDEVSQEGDVLVATGAYEKASWKQYKTPETGAPVMKTSSWGGKTRKQVLAHGSPAGWHVYRKSGPRKLPGNPHFSKELPLP